MIWIFGVLLGALQRSNYENSKLKSQKRNCAATVPVSTFMCLSDLYIPTIDLPIQLQKICGPILGIKIAHRHRNVEIGILLKWLKVPPEAWKAFMMVMHFLT
jgi:hypothetical protein